jgi:hypothetical protein
MVDIGWSQVCVALAGEVVGGISDFLANSLQQRQELLRLRQNVACALMDEIEALGQFIKQGSRLNGEGPYQANAGIYPHRHVPVERDYMPVFRGLGGNTGLLPSPLPRDVVTWYTRFAVCLERTRELHDLALNRYPGPSAYGEETAERQHAELTDLVCAAEPLLNRLLRVGGRRAHA